MKRRAYYDPDIHMDITPPDGQRQGALWACRTIRRLVRQDRQDRLAYIQNDVELEDAINLIVGCIAGLEMKLEGAQLDAMEKNGRT